MLKWHIGALICPFSYYFMTDFIITDKLDNRQVELTFEQYYDLQLGLKCAADVFTEADNLKRVNEFQSLLNLLT